MCTGETVSAITRSRVVWEGKDERNISFAMLHPYGESAQGGGYLQFGCDLVRLRSRVRSLVSACSVSTASRDNA